MKKKMFLICLGILFCAAIVFAVYQKETVFKEYPFENLKPADIKSADASYREDPDANPLLSSKDVEKLCDILSRIKLARKSEHDAQYFYTIQWKYGLGAEGYNPYGESFTVTPKIGKPFTVIYHPLGRDEESAADFNCRFIAIEKNDKKVFYEVEKEDFGVLEEFYELHSEVGKKDGELSRMLREAYGIYAADLREYEDKLKKYID